MAATAEGTGIESSSSNFPPAMRNTTAFRIPVARLAQSSTSSLLSLPESILRQIIADVVGIQTTGGLEFRHWQREELVWQRTPTAIAALSLMNVCKLLEEITAQLLITQAKLEVLTNTRNPGRDRLLTHRLGRLQMRPQLQNAVVSIPDSCRRLEYKSKDDCWNYDTTLGVSVHPSTRIRRLQIRTGIDIVNQDCKCSKQLWFMVIDNAASMEELMLLGQPHHLKGMSLFLAVYGHIPASWSDPMGLAYLSAHQPRIVYRSLRRLWLVDVLAETTDVRQLSLLLAKNMLPGLQSLIISSHWWLFGSADESLPSGQIEEPGQSDYGTNYDHFPLKEHHNIWYIFVGAIAHTECKLEEFVFRSQPHYVQFTPFPRLEVLVAALKENHSASLRCLMIDTGGLIGTRQQTGHELGDDLPEAYDPDNQEDADTDTEDPFEDFCVYDKEFEVFVLSLPKLVDVEILLPGRRPRKFTKGLSPKGQELVRFLERNCGWGNWRLHFPG